MSRVHTRQQHLSSLGLGKCVSSARVFRESKPAGRIENVGMMRLGARQQNWRKPSGLRNQKNSLHHHSDSKEMADKTKMEILILFMNVLFVYLR